MKTKRLAAFCLAALMTMGLAACGSSNGPQGGVNELAIYAVNLGEGIGWIESLMDNFKEESWVKEKYPNLTYYFNYNDSESYATSLMEAGKGGNPYDLLFGSYLSQFTSSDMVYDMTDSVYNAMIPEEYVTVKSKLADAMIKQKAVTNAQGGTSYYTINWSASLEGLVYNAEKLASYGYEMPVTTDEFLVVCDNITNNKKKDGTPIVDGDGYACLSSREGNAYWSYLFHPLVAQYMSPEGYENFFNGIDQYNKRSEGIFNNKASLRVMEFLQELFKFDNHYLYAGSEDVDYMAAQLQFYKGKGVFMPNGSWLEREMSNLVQQAKGKGDKIYDIRFMKYPIISDIIEVLPDKTITDDTTLRAVIRAIDANETAYEGVSEDDFNYVAKARSVVKYINDLDCCIPAYADSKDLAADFLIYAASNKGIEAYYQGASGPSPFFYDLKTENPEIYQGLSNFAKSRVDIYYGNAAFKFEISVPSTRTKMAELGGIALTRKDYREFYGNFSQTDSSKVISAKTIWDETKNYWTRERFEEALRKAGY